MYFKIFILHFLCQMQWMENVGNATFVHLPVVCFVGQLHGFDGKWCVDQCIHLYIHIVLYYSMTAAEMQTV